MNSVAYQKVATMVSANLSAASNTSISSKSSGDFSKVFNQVNAQKDNSSNVKSPEQAEVNHDKSHIAKAEDTLERQEIQPVEDEAKESLDEVKGDVIEIMDQPKEDELHQAVEEAIEVISEIFGIPTEVLQSILNQSQMTLTDLSDGGNLIQVVQEVFGHDDMSSMLLDPEATRTLKEVKEAVGQLLQDLGIESGELVSMLQQAKGGPGTQVKATETTTPGHTTDPIVNDGAEGLKGGEVEVVDLREGKNTSAYSDDSTGGQNRQTFGEMISQQIATVRDTLAVGETAKSPFQQISTSEVIDQIVTKAIVNLSDEKTSMALQLNPGHLGKVAVSVTAEQGVVKGQFIAENNVVKEMLETNMIQLKTQLEEQGIKVDKIEVTLGNATDYFDQRQQDNQEQASRQKKSRRVGRISRMMQMEEAQVSEAEVKSPVEASLDVHTVEYSA